MILWASSKLRFNDSPHLFASADNESFCFFLLYSKEPRGTCFSAQRVNGIKEIKANKVFSINSVQTLNTIVFKGCS